MIQKHRIRGILFTLLAIASTVTFVWYVRKSMQPGHRVEASYFLLLDACFCVFWTLASYYMGRAKGYQSDELGRVLVITFLLGFCCQPIALIFPFLGFFLKDRNLSGRRSRRRSRRPETRDDHPDAGS